MKNLLHTREDAWEELPKRVSRKDVTAGDPDRIKWHYHKDFPYARVRRWLEAHIGQVFDDVVAKYVKLAWVLPKDRTYHKLVETLDVRTHTFLRDGKIFYMDDRPWGRSSNPEVALDSDSMYNYHGVTFYVHPVRKTLEAKYAKGRKQRQREREAQSKQEFVYIGPIQQMVLIDGIWYYQWLEPDPRKMEWGKLKAVPRRAWSEWDFRPAHVIVDYKKTVSLYPQKGIMVERVSQEPIYKEIPGPKMHRKQLNSKELKRWGLKNDFKPVKYKRHID
jgi:hypothetical protein